MVNKKDFRLVEDAIIHARLAPATIRERLAPCFSAPTIIVSVHAVVLVVDLVLIMFYAFNAIAPLQLWQQIETLTSETYHVPKVLCGKMNVVIILGLVGTTLEFAMAACVLHLDVDQVWREDMLANADHPTIASHIPVILASVILGVLALYAFFVNQNYLCMLMVLWGCVPAVVGFPQDMMVSYVLHRLTAASKRRVIDFRDNKISTVGGGGTAWNELVKGYMDLRKGIFELWNKFGILLLASLVLDGGGCFFFFALSLEVELAVGWRVAYAIFSLILACSVLGKLAPLAEITSLCHSTEFRSADAQHTLPQAAMSVATRSPDETERAIMFCNHLRNFPTGICLPGGIEVSYALITSCCKLLAVYGSVAATLALRYLFSQQG